MNLLDNCSTPYLELLNYREQIANTYFKVYSDYTKIVPVNLDSKVGSSDDITLDFTNCTVCFAKPYISKRSIGENYVMIQPCLRNNHIDLLQNIRDVSNYMSFFTMLGGYCYIRENDDWREKFNDIVNRQFEFFRQLYPDSFIRLTIPGQFKQFLPLDDEIIKKLESGNCSIIYSYCDEKNLQWKYGIEGILGYGTRWEIQNKNGIFINCGNDIVLFDETMKAIGIDFGSGLETLVAIKYGNHNLLYSNIVCSDEVRQFCFDNQQLEKLIDCLTSVICIFYYKKYISLRVKSLIEKYIKIIASISIVHNVSNEVLELLLFNICNSLKIENDSFVEEIIQRVIEHQNFLKEIVNSGIGQNVINSYDFDKNEVKNSGYFYEGYLKKMMQIEMAALRKFVDECSSVKKYKLSKNN